MPTTIAIKPMQQPANPKGETMPQRTRPFPAKLVPAVLAGLTFLPWTPAARAEPVTNRVLAGYQMATAANCSLFKINFNFRIRYVSHFPVSSGNELRIMFEPIDPGRFLIEGSPEREALRPPVNSPAGIKAIQYETRIAESPTLTILFNHPVNFNVRGGIDFQSLIVSVSDHSRACKPDFPGGAADAWNAVPEGETVVSRRQVPREMVVEKRAPKAIPIPDVAPTEVPGSAQPVADNLQGGATAKLVADARAAMRQNNYAQAITLLRKAVAEPENAGSPEARELLGVAYQKDKQTAAAKAVYEDYVKRYPNGEGTEGVRQRLMALETAQAQPVAALRAPVSGPVEISGGPVESNGSGQAQPNTSYVTMSGSVSQFYIKDDSYRVVRDPTQALNLNATKDDLAVHQNTLMSNVDASAAWGDGNVKSKFRFSGTEEHLFDRGDTDLWGISALYLDTSIKDWGTTFRVGRQIQNSNGILGRFDGAVITYQWNPWFGVSAVGGSPVESRFDLPFKDDMYFYGASVNFTHLFGGLDASVYGIEQRARQYIDRQAVGTEWRYADDTKFAFLTVDYDTYFNELDAAIFTGSWTLPDKSSVRLTADYRKAPYLTAWNALQGQAYVSLYDLLKANTLADVRQMAIDRTATYESANVGYTRQLTDKLQVNLDFTAAHIDGTIASYGVLATPDMGTEFYYSAQLVGTSLIKDGDVYTAAFRYSDLQESDNYAIDLSTRYPISEEWNVAPRLTTGYRTGKVASYDEYMVLPSLLVDYIWWKDFNLELEVGERWTWHNQGTAKTTENEFFATAGFRYDFYANSRQKCTTWSVLCR